MHSTYRGALLIMAVCFACTVVLLTGAYWAESHCTYQTKTAVEDNRETPPWQDIFSFLPVGNVYCDNVFKGVDKKYPSRATYEKELELLDEELSRVKKRLKMKEVQGYTAMFPEESRMLHELIERTRPYVDVICETGFNAGHSSLQWIIANPTAKIYSFDIGRWEYSRPMAEYLMKRYPRRLNVTWGNSLMSLPAWRRLNPSFRCDFIIIDGGHTYNVANSDWQNFRLMASKNSLVFMDNYPDTHFNEELGLVWEEAKWRKEVAEVFRCSHKLPKTQGYVFGLVN